MEPWAQAWEGRFAEATSPEPGREDPDRPWRRGVLCGAGMMPLAQGCGEAAQGLQGKETSSNRQSRTSL